MEFCLHEAFKKKRFLINLKLSSVFLENSEYPWVILVPRCAGVVEISDLSEANQKILMDEISFVSLKLKDLYKCDKLNIANIGNMVSDLHIHIICRYKTDKFWPDTVWNKDIPLLSDDQKSEYVKAIRAALGDFNG